MRRTNLLLVLALSLMLSSLIVGCAPVGNASDQDATSSVDLDGTSWTLVQIGQDVLPGSTATLIFADGQVQGNATCNRFSGSYERNGAQLSFGMLRTTRMACENMDQEASFLAALAAVMTYRLQDGRLVLSDGQDDLLVLEPTQPATLEGTTWQLTGLNTGTAIASVLDDTQITATFGDGQVAGSAGCNRYFGSVTVQEGKLTVGMLGSTEMYCGEPEGVMDQEIAYLKALQSAAAFEIEGDVLTILDGNGNRALEFTVTEN